ncbi:hypothetical protein BGX33_001456 [Mortierella sp. NVP41]|nr:hypothetical protein BGX33_001456 [Mortierella sp. NVP41]
MEQILRLSIRKRIRVLKESSLDNVKTLQILFPRETKVLVLKYLTIDLQTFSELLRLSPHLAEVDLYLITFTEPSPSVTFDPYKSTSVRHVVSRGTLLPQSGELQLELPALFVHFPEVTKWAHFMRNLTDPDVSCEGLRAALAEVCSKLTRVHFQGNKPNLVSQMLSQAIARVKHLQITAMWYDPQLPFPSLYRFGSHLDHQDSLVTIEFTANGLEQVHSQPIASATIFNRVTRLSVRSHITTIEAFEDGEWVCRNLRILRVRVEGLNNKDDIDICLTDLKAARNTVEWWSSGDVIVVQGQTIEHRVNRQLLNLNRLQTVCMGTDDYYLAANGKRMGSGDGMGNRVKRQLLKQPKLNTVWLGTRTFALATK